LLVVAAIFHSAVVGVADTVVHGGGVVDGAATCSGGGGSPDEVVDDKVAEAWQRGAVPAASRRFSASLSDRSRVRTVGIVAATNLVTCAVVPTSSIYMALRDRGPPAVYWAGRPRSGCESRVQLAVGPTGGDQH